MQDHHCIDSRAVDKGDLRMSGIMVRQLVGAAGPRLAGIIITSLGDCFPAEPGGTTRDSEDKVDVLQGHQPAKVRARKRESTSPLSKSEDRHSFKC